MSKDPSESAPAPASAPAFASDEGNNQAGERTGARDPQLEGQRAADDAKLFAYMKTFIVPTLLLKASIIYFGLNYSNDPGQGYGWGLLISVVLSLFNFALFIYKNWNDSEEGA